MEKLWEHLIPKNGSGSNASSCLCFLDSIAGEKHPQLPCRVVLLSGNVASAKSVWHSDWASWKVIEIPMRNVVVVRAGGMCSRTERQACFYVSSAIKLSLCRTIPRSCVFQFWFADENAGHWLALAHKEQVRKSIWKTLCDLFRVLILVVWEVK